MAQIVKAYTSKPGILHCLPPPVANRVLMRRQPAVPDEKPLVDAVNPDVLNMLGKHRHQCVRDMDYTLRAILRGSSRHFALPCALEPAAG